jgi:dipeptidyl aminopeptidase/acylaminoacyl peptidase
MFKNFREISKLPFVDSRRMAVWGWSYGGYLATKILAIDAK